jgi:hypothetical protein
LTMQVCSTASCLERAPSQTSTFLVLPAQE